MFVLEVFPLVLYSRDATNAPTHTQVNFLMLPPFSEDCAPQSAHDTVHGGEMTEEQPGYSSKSRREDEEGEV